MSKRGLKVVLSVFLAFAVLLILVSADTNSTNGTSALTTTLTGTSNSSSASTSTTTGVTDLTQGDSDKVDKAYTCLEDQLKAKTSSQISLQEAIFSTLALGYRESTMQKINDEEKNSCWPKANCNVKETAQVMLTYQLIGRDYANIEKWLLSKNSTTGDLAWYLEIDATNHLSSQCTIKHGSAQDTVKINPDMTVELTGGSSCLSVSSNRFWLRVSDSCISTQFEVSCDQDFVTSLIYQRSSDGTVYVSPETHSASSLGTTKEQVNVQCFKTSATCDYEGTMWASLALQVAGQDVSAFTPYLLAFSPDNSRYLPSSFLYLLTGDGSSYDDLARSQKNNKFWETSEKVYGRYYDTSVAMMALAAESKKEAVDAQNYLLSIQTDQGCWNANSIRDTSFLLYSSWPRSPTPYGGNDNPISTRTCSDAGYSCEYRFACIDAGANVMDEYSCSGQLGCCSQKLDEKTCSEQNGVVCADGESCSSSIVSSSDGGCCTGTCTPTNQEDQCTQGGGSCEISCSSGYQENSNLGCSDSSRICCIKSESGSSTWIWIVVILIILIALVALGIVYRDKLRVWLYQMRGKASSKPVTKQSGSGVPPAGGRPFFGPRPPFGGSSTMARRPDMPVPKAPSKDKDMDDTLKKLKEMSE